MKKLLVVLLITLSPFLKADISGYINGEGRFMSKDGDSLSFIKKQLLAAAFRDVLSKELKTLGLDDELLWSRIDQKFNSYFDPISENMKKRYGVEEGSKASAKKKRKYRDALRIKKKVLKSKYGNLHRAISQYSIKRMTRSPQVPNARYLKVQAKVNREALHDIFLSFTTENIDRSFKSLYLSSSFEIQNMAWNDMGVEIERDFTSVVMDEWKEKLEQTMKSQVQEVVIADESINSKLSEIMKLPIEALSSVDKGFSSGLWLKFHFKISKVSEDILLKKRGYRISGDILLVDLATQKIVGHSDFSEVTKVYHTGESSKLSSNLASLIFRLPMTDLKKFTRKVSSIPKRKGKATLSILSYRNIGDVLKLQKILSDRGITQQIRPSLNSFDNRNAKIFLEYANDLEGVKRIINSLDGLSISKGNIFRIPNKSKPFEVQISKASGNEGQKDGSNVR